MHCSRAAATHPGSSATPASLLPSLECASPQPGILAYTLHTHPGVAQVVSRGGTGHSLGRRSPSFGAHHWQACSHCAQHPTHLTSLYQRINCATVPSELSSHSKSMLNSTAKAQAVTLSHATAAVGIKAALATQGNNLPKSSRQHSCPAAATAAHPVQPIHVAPHVVHNSTGCGVHTACAHVSRTLRCCPADSTLAATTAVINTSATHLTGGLPDASTRSAVHKVLCINGCCYYRATPSTRSS